MKVSVVKAEEKPTPVGIETLEAPNVEVLRIPEGYEQLASKLGIKVKAIKDHEYLTEKAKRYQKFVQFLIDCDVKLYPMKAVCRYMDYMVAQANAKGTLRSYQVIWGWKRFNKSSYPFGSVANNSAKPNSGFGLQTIYDKTIPMEILQLADKLISHPSFKNLNLSLGITDYEVKVPDPFLGLFFDNKVYVVAVWDEPTFKIEPEDYLNE